MRLVLAIACVIFSGACRCRPLAHDDEQPLRVSPAQLAYGRVALTFTGSRSISVTNPNSFSVDLRWSITGPFALPTPPASIPGGASVMQTVSFTPSVEAAAAGTLSVNDFTVALTGEGFDPHCQSGPCSSSTYDPTAGVCVPTVQPDGTDCSGKLSCLSTAACHAGQCVGTVINCDDQNPCTLDVCGTTGCGHVDALPYCPQPADPCQVPSCDPASGCGATAAPDGTACGARDCHNAQVCIAGACVRRPVPQDQSCIEVVAGVPAGYGTADGTSLLARFQTASPMAFDDAGNLYVVDNSTLRKISPNGMVKTLAGVAGAYDLVDGFGSAARFMGPTGIVFDGVNLVVHDTCALRKVTLSGLVSTWVGGASCDYAGDVDGIGRQATVWNAWGISSSLARTPDGELWFVDDHSSADRLDGGVWLREVNPNGEVFTRGSIQLIARAPGDAVFFDSIAALPDGRLLASQQSQSPTGSEGLDSTIEVFRNGATRPTAFPAGWFLASAPAGTLASSLGSDLLLFLVDGGVTTVAHSQSQGFADGPVDAGLFGWPAGSAMNAQSDVAFSDPVNHDVRLVHAGQLSTLAGPHPDRRSVDGAGHQGRLGVSTDLCVAPSGAAYFSDAASLRRLDTTGTLSTIVATDAGSEVDGPFSLVGIYPYALACTSTGDVIFSEGLSVRLASLTAAMVSTLELGSDGVWDVAVASDGAIAWLTISSPNGTHLWLQPPSGPRQDLGQTAVQWLTSDPAGGFVMGGYSLLQHLDTAGVIAGLPTGMQYWSAGSIDPSGNLYAVDVLTNLIVRRSPTGATTAVLDLADHATALAAEPAGSVLILVPDALLRYHP